MLARIISYVFHPSLIPTLGFALLFQLDTYLKFAIRPQLKVYLLIIIFLNTFLFPILVLVLLRARKTISSFKLEKRQERLIPFGVSSVFYVFTYNLFLKAPLPPIVTSIFLGITASVILLFALTFFKKISAHMMAISGLLGAVLAMYLKFSSNFSVVIGLLALIWGLVAYARITLKAHTEFEIYTGSILGLLVVFCTTFWGVTI